MAHSGPVHWQDMSVQGACVQSTSVNITHAMPASANTATGSGISIPLLPPALTTLNVLLHVTAHVAGGTLVVHTV
jgi:hypothetical protein